MFSKEQSYTPVPSAEEKSMHPLGYYLFFIANIEAVLTLNK